MTVQWLDPAAWWGLAALAVPILIHLLVRQDSRRLLFPSLRFLRTTAVASWRRKFVSDWPLLLVRLAILALAVAALAGPLALTPGRLAQWQQRMARAIVVSSNVDSPGATVSLGQIVRSERESSAFAATFVARPLVADALRDASAWLEAQPPAGREVVIVSEARNGAITAGDLAVVPENVGVRFSVLPIPPPAAPMVMTAVAEDGDDATAAYRIDVTAGNGATSATYQRVGSAESWLAVQAPAADRRHAEAARAAALAEGLVNDAPGERRVTVVFSGPGVLQAGDLAAPAADSWMRGALDRLPGLAAGERQGRLIVLAGVPATDPGAVNLLADVARIALTASRVDREPLAIAPERLAEWTRPPGPIAETAVPRDEGDRRWLWGVVLALLAVEHVLRRGRNARGTPASSREHQEARVA
jgi:hypothetical protein